MKLGTLAAAAALAMAMTLGGSVTPADAGKKNRAHQGTSSGKVHIDSKVSTKNLRALEKKLHGDHKRAVQREIHQREYDEREQKRVGEWLATSDEPIINLWAIGTELGTKRKRGH